MIWHDIFPEVCLKLFTINPSSGMLDDHLTWKCFISGDLILKYVYLFKAPASFPLKWANVIWSIDIPPSKSLLVWRLMHNKVPGNDMCHGEESEAKLLIRLES